MLAIPTKKHIQNQLLHQSGPRWRQVGTKLAPKIDQKWGTPSDLGAKNGVPHRPLGPTFRKKWVKKMNATKTTHGLISLAVF